MTVKDCDLAKEILMLLPYIDKNYLKKLPWDFINNLKDLAALSNKDFAFENGKNFKEIDIYSECKAISLIYNHFKCLLMDIIA